MKRIVELAVVAVLTAAFTAAFVPREIAHAQNPAITPLQYTFSSSAAVHTDCAVTAGASLTITATAPLTATTSGSTVTVALPSTALKTAVDGLGLTAAAAPVQ